MEGPVPSGTKLPFQDVTMPTRTKGCKSKHITTDKETKSPLLRSLPLVFLLMFLGRHWVSETSLFLVAFWHRVFIVEGSICDAGVVFQGTACAPMLEEDLSFQI